MNRCMDCGCLMPPFCGIEESDFAYICNDCLYGDDEEESEL